MAENSGFGDVQVVEEGVEAGAALWAQLEMEEPEAGTEIGEPVVCYSAGREPVMLLAHSWLVDIMRRIGSLG